MTASEVTPIWKTIPGYPNYEVSSDGDIKRNGRYVSQAPNNGGYLVVRLHHEGYGRSYLVHRIVLLAFVGPCPDGQEARHLDGDRKGNRIDNLIWGTRSENMYDVVRHGRNWQVNKTHCKQGHPFSPENTKQHKNGRRECITCRHIAGRRWEAKIAKGTGKGWRSKPVINLDDGSVYPSATAAAIAFGTNRRAIIQVCLGYKGRKTTAGRRFAYAEGMVPCPG